LTRDDNALMRACPHCGSSDAVRLGVCGVCELIVCSSCGNSQYTGHGRRVYHDACLSKQPDEDSGFKMIKFVK